MAAPNSSAASISFTPLRRYADGEEAAAAEQRDGDAERMLALEKLNLTDAGGESNGRLKPAPSEAFVEREDADADRGQVERVGGADAARRHREPRRIGEAVAGMKRLISLTNSSGPPNVTASSPACRSHRDVGLLAVLRVER